MRNFRLLWCKGVALNHWQKYARDSGRGRFHFSAGKDGPGKCVQITCTWRTYPAESTGDRRFIFFTPFRRAIQQTRWMASPVSPSGSRRKRWAGSTRAGSCPAGCDAELHATSPPEAYAALGPALKQFRNWQKLFLIHAIFAQLPSRFAIL